MNAKQQVLDALDDIEKAILELSGNENAAKRQTDLEVAILKKQIARQAEAKKKINLAIDIIRKAA